MQFKIKELTATICLFFLRNMCMSIIVILAKISHIIILIIAFNHFHESP